jgi:P-type conjugative transfer protein TrbJ
MKSMRRNVVVALASSMIISSANAGTVAGNGGATEITQILNNSELVYESAQMYAQVQQTIQQVTMMQQQLKNLLNLPNLVWGTAQQDLNQLTSLVAKGQALGYALGNIDQKFSAAFPGYTGSPLKANFQSQSSSWIKTTLDSMSGALSAAGMRSSQFATEQTAMDTIASQAGNAQGELQIAQAGVTVASMEVQQLQKLSQLYMAQMQSQNAYQAFQVQQKANDLNTNAGHFTVYAPSGSTFSSAGGSH